ncbi:unnamed protein product [Sphagnum balticum]
MYGKCGSMQDAWRVFNKMPSQDVATWNAMIFGYVKCGQGQKALELFQRMQQEGVWPDRVTLVGVLNACASVVALEEGRGAHEQIIQRGIMALEEGRHAHEQIIQNGCESDAFVGSSLIAMYAKCGSMEEASRVFNKLPSPAVVCWTAMIFGHVKCGEGHKALELFQKMQQEGVQPDPVTYVGVLNACANVVALEEGRLLNACAGLRALEEGRRAHQLIVQTGCEADVFVGSSLVDMYAKCGHVEDALRVFNKMPSRDVVTWSALILGHVKYGQGQKALELFRQMQQEDVVTWTAMILGYVRCGQGQKALELYKRMQQEGVQPNTVTFMGVLNASCSHAGFVDEGLRFYALMTTVYRIPAKLEHYTCMVDLLGRAGHLQEAENMIQGMPCKPNAAIWTALLGACRIHGNVEMGERMAKRVLELEPKNAAGFVLLSNLYAATGNLELSENVERQRKERDAKKQPGRTWIEVNDAVHTFCSR